MYFLLFRLSKLNIGQPMERNGQVPSAINLSGNDSEGIFVYVRFIISRPILLEQG